MKKVKQTNTSIPLTIKEKKSLSKYNNISITNAART